MKLIKALILCCLFFFNIKPIDMYICTCADSYFFPRLLNFIGSLHRVNFNEIKEIAVFNLGLTQKQMDQLNKIEKISVHDIELTHPDLLNYFDAGRPDKRKTRGWYAWKPVAIKQALDMFPYILYADAGMTFLRPLDQLFKHIIQNDYFFVNCPNTIKWMATQHVVETFDLKSPERKWLMGKDVKGLSGGFMGLTQKLYDNFVFPMYKLAHNIENFVDDGTTPNGFGTGRHDQVLFSIHAKLLNLTIRDWFNTHLNINGKKVKFRTRGGIVKFWPKGNDQIKFKKYIQYKK